MLVTIITPVFNHQNYIEECIESIINQTYTNWEMLVIDDGSNDDTAQIVNKYVLMDSRIKYFYQDNIGIYRLSESYNFALGISKGQIITILEGDDVWKKNKLEQQVREFEKDNSLVLCFCDCEIIYKNGLFLNSEYISKKDLSYANNIPNCSFIKFYLNYTVYPVSVAISKSRLLEIGGFIQKNNQPATDTLTFLNLSRLGNFKYINQSLAIYRRQPQQVTRILAIEIMDTAHKNFIEFYKKLNETEVQSTKISIDYINKKFERFKNRSFAIAGRRLLSEGNFSMARKMYFKALTSSNLNLKWRLKSFIGIAFSILNLDLENFIKKIGRPSY